MLALPVQAAQTLVAAEVTLEQPPQRVQVVSWAKENLVMVVSPVMGDPAKGEPLKKWLDLYRFRDGKLSRAFHWWLPPDTRWLEMIRLPGGEEGWLSLTGGRWLIGRAKGNALTWKTACACPGVFGDRQGAVDLREPLAQDLDGDGVSEVMVPGWNGVTVYRIAPDTLAMEPLWRDALTVSQSFSRTETGLRGDIQFYQTQMVDANGDGVLDVVEIRYDTITLFLHPTVKTPVKGTWYALDPEKRFRLASAGMEGALSQALAQLNGQVFASREELLKALHSQAPESQWKGWQDKIVAMAAEPMLLVGGQPIAIPGMKPVGPGEIQRVLSVEDMNKDGIPDVMLVKTSEEGDAFNQKNQMFWFAGQRNNQAWGLNPTPQLFLSEGLSFNYLVYPSPRPQEAMGVFTGTMEISLVAVIRYITSRGITLDAYYIPWKDGRLTVPPPIHETLTFKADFSKGSSSRPMLVTADLDGDGWREFVFNNTPETLEAYQGVKGGPRLGYVIATGAIPLPKNREMVMTADLNKDGREELVVWYGGTANGRSLRVVHMKPEQAGQ
ncbi:MAG: VCBS repeat-containing protein [Deltaproteobacteria bacterium]|nr:VCBS repeat-containing protein [Deltaproteobacteria bacterium]MDH4121996.1 VCBS repeat-containing protein [Deltaproteobacteria bacterium]